jgi:hypothetical protein
MAIKYSKWPRIPNGYMYVDYTNVFHSKALQNLPELLLFIRKYTIWQPCGQIQKL